MAHLIGLVVATSRRGAAVRRWTLIFLGGIIWAIVAYSLHPYTPNSDPMRSLLEYPFRALFAPDVFKHVLIGAFVFWFAFRVAAIYLDDIFELKSVRIAEKFIRQSAFASQYDVIEIKDGEVALKDQKSPIFLIGGPGNVRVYLENAALFEKSNGTPHVIEPTTPRTTQQDKENSVISQSWMVRLAGFYTSLFRLDGSDSSSKQDGAMVLESFERLRKVIDLRDQVEEITVDGRTRDGIPIRAKNLRVIFSVLRDGEEPTLEKPYPFNQKAVENLVYGLTRESWTDAMSAQIKRELGNFIARHTLSEFLAAIGTPELEQSAQIEVDLQAEADRLVGLDQDTEVNISDPPPFVHRPAISDLFYDYNDFVARVREKGVELRWIGVGTWALPSEIIPERHLQAWRITYENLAWGSETAVKKLFQTKQAEQLLFLIQETPVNRFNNLDLNDGAKHKNQMMDLVNGYRGKLHAALEVYERRDESDTPIARRVREVWTYLAHVVAHYAGDNIDGS
jgi:hypothetical protein